MDKLDALSLLLKSTMENSERAITNLTNEMISLRKILQGDGDSKGITSLLTNLETRMAEMEKSHVTQDEFTPVKKIVYGGTTIILSGVVVAVLELIIRG
jgi:hypothetical protein